MKGQYSFWHLCCLAFPAAGQARRETTGKQVHFQLRQHRLIRTGLQGLSLIGFLLLFCTPLFSQTVPQNVDSLRRVWYRQGTAVADSLQLQAGWSLQKNYALTSLDSLRIISNDLETQSREPGKHLWYAYALWGHGLLKRYSGQLDSAKLYFGKAASLLHSREDKLLPDIYLAEGNLWFSQGILDSTLNYFQLALSARIKLGLPAGVIYNNIGGVYAAKGMNLEAFQYYSEGKKSNDPYTQTLAALNVSNILSRMGIQEEAYINAAEAVELAEKQQSKATRISAYSGMVELAKTPAEMHHWLQRGLALADTNQFTSARIILLSAAGHNLLKQHQLDEAEFYFNEALALIKQFDDDAQKSYLQLCLSQVYVEKGRPVKAIELCRTTLPYYSNIQDSTSLGDAYAVLSKSFEALGQIDSALYYSRKREYMVVNNQNNSLQHAIYEYVAYKSEREREALRQAKENAEAFAQELQARERLSYWFFGLVCLFLTGIALFYYVYSRHKQKSADQLMLLNSRLLVEQQKLEISNSRLRRFSSIVSHDILSNLDLVLSAGNVLVGPHAKKESLAQYYDMTQRTSRHLKDYCLYLLEETKQATPSAGVLHDPMPVIQKVLSRFKPALDARNFRVEVGNISPAHLPEVLVEQVFQNLISNVLRHGATAQTPWLRIAEEQDTQGHSQWVVEDNGPGIPPGQQASILEGSNGKKQANGKGQGLGLSLVKAELRDYDADLLVAARPGGGARFVVVFGQ